MRKTIKGTVAKVFSVVLTGAILTGCGESNQSRQDIQKDSSPSVVQEAQKDMNLDEAGTEAAGKNNQTAVTYEDNFAVGSEEARKFAEKVKTVVADKDLDALAALISFPVYIGLPDVGGVESEDEFLKLGAEAVFTEELLRSVEVADIENLQPSMAGFSISDGGACNIIFGVADGILVINGINY